MTDLSPSAQAVLDAAEDVYFDWSDVSPCNVIAAAVLRVAAAQASYCLDGSAYYVVAKYDLLAIAAELEGANG